MDSKIILGRILQKFIDLKVSKYQDYNEFGFVNLTGTSVLVSRENGADTNIPLNKIITAIEGYQNNLELYNQGPSELRDLGISHITSPIHSLLHLLPNEVYIK
jgi:hypothetical protein